MTETQKKLLVKATVDIINKMGLEEFKKMSLFASNRLKRP